MIVVVLLLVVGCAQKKGVEKKAKPFPEEESQQQKQKQIVNSQEKIDKEPLIEFLKDSIGQPIGIKFKGDSTLDENNVTIQSLNPYIKRFENAELQNYPRFLKLGENVNKYVIEEFLPKFSFDRIPDDYFFDFASTGIINSNIVNDKIALSFIFEWGGSLLAENSEPDFSTSRIVVFNEFGEQTYSLFSDGSIRPFLSNNGALLILAYRLNVQDNYKDHPIFNQGLKIIDLHSKLIIYDEIYHKELRIGGINNFGDFTFFVGDRRGEFTQYVLRDTEKALYSKDMSQSEMQELLKDFDGYIKNKFKKKAL